MSAATTPDGEVPLPIRFGSDGLVPAVIQETESQAVLMVGFMNTAALAATRATGRVHFWSRSRSKLWRKGETSGHEQVVEEIHVNCELNSLLVTVRQIGAVCHDGYATCYYRRLEDDNSLAKVAERVFDPAAVYGDAALAEATRRLYGAYAYLRDNDLTAVSRTSARLRDREDTVTPRVGEELLELAGALDGSHRHAEFAADVLLEGTQVLYWTILTALRERVAWEALRPDRALLTAAEGMAAHLLASVIRAEARVWLSDGLVEAPLAARCHAVLALVGQACQSAGHPPLTLVETDLSSLRERPYLARYFASPVTP